LHEDENETHIDYKGISGGHEKGIVFDDKTHVLQVDLESQDTETKERHASLTAYIQNFQEIKATENKLSNVLKGIPDYEGKSDTEMKDIQIKSARTYESKIVGDSKAKNLKKSK
jgi:hypothetical protein